MMVIVNGRVGSNMRLRAAKPATGAKGKAGASIEEEEEEEEPNKRQLENAARWAWKAEKNKQPHASAAGDSIEGDTAGNLADMQKHEADAEEPEHETDSSDKDRCPHALGIPRQAGIVGCFYASKQSAPSQTTSPRAKYARKMHVHLL
jgi:hypothetical protein